MPLGIHGITTERATHISASGTVIILEERINLEALHVSQLRSSVISHRIPVSCIGWVLIGSHQITRGRQTEPARRSAAKDNHLRLHDHELASSYIYPNHTNSP